MYMENWYREKSVILGDSLVRKMSGMLLLMVIREILCQLCTKTYVLTHSKEGLHHMVSKRNKTN